MIKVLASAFVAQVMIMMIGLAILTMGAGHVWLPEWLLMEFESGKGPSTGVAVSFICIMTVIATIVIGFTAINKIWEE